MTKILNEDTKLKASPGTCSPQIKGSYSSDVKIDGKKALKEEIKFRCNGGTWKQLSACNGSGTIEGTCSNVSIDGKKAILQTDFGKCKGQGIDPATGNPTPCNCVVKISSTQSTLELMKR